MKENELAMKIVHPNAAGIDIGSKSHWVAVDQIPGNVREFGVYTRDHHRLIDHLKSHQITTVAMESTGSYWQSKHSTWSMFDSICAGPIFVSEERGKREIFDRQLLVGRSRLRLGGQLPVGRKQLE